MQNKITITTMNIIEKQFEIECLQFDLATTDYKAIKYAEGLMPEEDYAPIKAERMKLRDRINELEEELKRL